MRHHRSDLGDFFEAAVFFTLLGLAAMVVYQIAKWLVWILLALVLT